MQDRRAFVLLSGGLDSTTCLAVALQSYDRKQITAISFDYQQRHSIEITQAKYIATAMGVGHKVMALEEMPKTMLTDKDAAVPDISYGDITGVSPMYVPFRNGLMLSKVASFAAGTVPNKVPIEIFIGTHAEDAANDAYPDCRLDFIGAMGAAMYIGSYHQIRIRAPLIEMLKSDIVRLGFRLNVPFEHTWSCYKGGAVHCGTCATCRSRKKAFETARVEDPTEYAA